MASAQEASREAVFEQGQLIGGRRSLAVRLLRAVRSQPLGAVAAVVLVAIWLACLLAPLLAPFGWDDLFTGPKLSAPAWGSAHLFGTDETGRDVLSRVLYGGRITLLTSLVATVGGVFLASVLGIVSGYVLGVFDLGAQRLSDALQALPGLVVLMVVAAVFRQNLWAVIVVLMVLAAPGAARVLRSQAIAIRNMAYIEASRAVGATPLRILLRHIVPNVFPLIIVLFTVAVGANMLILTSLSFLGVIDPSTPDWGTMLNTASQQFLTVAPWLAIFPGAAITLSVLGYNLMGDALRDALDPRLRGSRR